MDFRQVELPVVVDQEDVKRIAEDLTKRGIPLEPLVEVMRKRAEAMAGDMERQPPQGQ